MNNFIIQPKIYTINAHTKILQVSNIACILTDISYIYQHVFNSIETNKVYIEIIKLNKQMPINKIFLNILNKESLFIGFRYFIECNL